MIELLVSSLLLSAPLQTTPDVPEAEAEPATLDLAAPFQWRAIGPSTFGGRVVDLALHPDRPATVWVASASGGLWVTRDHGTTFECLFENEGTLSIGDIAVSPHDPDVIWVGTGEANNQRSSYWGDGVYRSDDGGATWTHVGLADSHHIGRIVVHPEEPDTVFVAALGHLYTPNEERGLYRTDDGGATWTKVLDAGPDVGVVDVVIDPNDPSRVMAATYERRRRAWDFDGNGPGSGIWRSLDGGLSFTRCEGGLPTGDIGRIGLDVFAGDRPLVVATVANQNRVEIERGPIIGLEVRWKDGRLGVTRVARGSSAAKLGIAKGDTITSIGGSAIKGPFDWVKVLGRLLEEGEPEEDAEEGAADAADETVAVTLSRKDEDGKATTVEIEASLTDLFAKEEHDGPPPTREIGGQVFATTDFGETWTRRNEDPVGGSPAYYYGQIRIDPTDADTMYMCSVPLYKSEDGGAKWSRIARSVHVDHHAVAIDPANPRKVWLGNDGGLHLSWDGGETWQHFTNLPISQFYAVGLDNSEPFRVFGGTQDNGTWGGPHTSRDPRGIHPVEWFTVGGGDGFYAQIDPRDPSTVYAESQFGAIYRRNLDRGTSVRIRPRKPEGAEEERLRFNWNSPILISRHNPEVIYFGGNRVFKSFNRGDTWPVHSPDLTTRDAEKIAGNVPHCTVTTLDESALDPGLLLAGTDDGLVHMSSNGGYDWLNLTGQFPGVPSNWWVSRVTLSRHDRSTAYVSFTGYREDDFRPFIYVTDELGSGKSWRLISRGLPQGEPVNDIIEEPTNPGTLYAATEFGVHVSMDGGASWTRLGAELPRVAVHDLEVHERDGVLVAATHGRGFYALAVDAVRAMEPGDVEGPAHLWPVGDVTLWARRSAVGGYGGGDQVWRGTNEPREAELHLRLGAEVHSATLEIVDAGGDVIRTLELPETIAGQHRLGWDLRRAGKDGRRGRSASPGSYTARLTWRATEDGEPETQERRFRLRRDPLLDGASPAEMAAEDEAESDR